MDDLDLDFDIKEKDIKNVKVPMRGKKFAMLTLAAFLIFFGGLRVWQFYTPKANIILDGKPMNVLVAKTPDDIVRGLGKRDDLGEYEGMLFLFPKEGKHAIWMKDMRFAIDIIWLYKGKVVDIAPNITPEDVPTHELTRYFPRTDATTVLEVKAGWTVENDIRLGDLMTSID